MNLYVRLNSLLTESQAEDSIDTYNVAKNNKDISQGNLKPISLKKEDKVLLKESWIETIKTMRSLGSVEFCLDLIGITDQLERTMVDKLIALFDCIVAPECDKHIDGDVLAIEIHGKLENGDEAIQIYLCIFLNFIEKLIWQTWNDKLHYIWILYLLNFKANTPRFCPIT
ncbi:hypothetical protein GJ496_000878 [Pomphorhynchus laevis]|nr:hypothetical protein GJ496_000878 [Pomphorhynchus laevis]